MAKGIKIGEYLIHKQFGEDSYDDLLTREGLKKRTESEIEGERKSLITLMKERKDVREDKREEDLESSFTKVRG
jgi:hypothetical protein